MTQSVINTLYQRLFVSAVRDIVVSEIAESGAGHLRRIQILGEPVTNGNPTMILEITCTADLAERLRVTAPTHEF